MKEHGIENQTQNIYDKVRNNRNVIFDLPSKIKKTYFKNDDFYWLHIHILENKEVYLRLAHGGYLKCKNYNDAVNCRNMEKTRFNMIENSF